MIKTLLFYDERTVENHVGEEYDDILELTCNITQSNINMESNRISNIIRRLAVDGSVVKVTLDAALPYHAILMDLMLVMKPREGITIDYEVGRQQIIDAHKEDNTQGSNERKKEVQWLLDWKE